MESFGMKQKKEKPPYLDMGNRLIEVRKELTDMNQTQMTEALGLKEPTYGNYERGDRRMPPHIMEKFSRITGCRSDYVYLGRGPMTESYETQEAEQRILEKYRSLEDPQRQAFETMLDMIKPGER
jgi:DNA-binding XRE family transcriptional regulator